MPRSPRPSAALLTGLLAVALPGRPALSAPAGVPAAASAPLSGIVRANGRPLPGATLVVRGVTAGGATFLRLITSEPDGTFVLANAAEGLYTVLSVVPGFRPAVARLFHRPASPDGALSFVRIELERPSGVLPEADGGALDAWSARAIASGDVLRDVPAILTALDTVPGPASPVLLAASRDARATVPLRAAVTTTTGFGALGASSLSRASVDVSGGLGAGVKWGASGQYARADLAGEKTGDAARVALDVSAGASQSVRISTSRQSLSADADPTRFSAHALDWTGSVSEHSQAGVSARVVSQARLLATGPAGDLFALASDAVDVAARYQTDLGATTFARVSVGYRSMTGDYAGVAAPFTQETRAGGVAGLRLGEFLVVEGGATGDASYYGRGVTPELTVAIQTRDGWRLYAFASRRFESLSDSVAPRPGEAGAEEADLTRRSRSFYRAGTRWQNRDGEGIAVDVSRRELSGTYRLLFDADFLDRLDSLYFFPNDVATDASLTASARIGPGLDARVALRAGVLSGAREAVISSDEATWGVAQAALRLRGTDTSIGLGYRSVTQSLVRGSATLRNDIEAVDVSLAQGLPFPMLKAIGSDWRALFSVEFGRRQQGEEEERSNRRLAGGLSLSF